LPVMCAWSMLLSGASEDGGISAQRRPVQLQIADYRPTSQRKPTADEIRAELVEALRAQNILVASDAKTQLWLELIESGKRDEEGIRACARVRSWIVNWIGVADAISRPSREKDAMTHAYAGAISEVVANLKRTLRL